MTEGSKHALIVGAGEGLSASLTRLLARNGFSVTLAARNPAKLAELCASTGAVARACDVTEPDDIAALFAAETPYDVVVYNPSYRVRGPIIELDPVEVHQTLDITAFGAFLVGQAAARQMIPRGEGTILFTGASASVKGFALSAPFAMGKFALRGLAQSMARELQPKGIHVGHVVIDGAIRPSSKAADGRDTMLDPDAIALSYWHLIQQHRSAWAWEIELRPYVETF